MPIPITVREGGGGADSAEGVQRLEQEVRRLRGEVESLRRAGGAGSGGGGVISWITTAMAALALLLGIVAMLR